MEQSFHWIQYFQWIWYITEAWNQGQSSLLPVFCWCCVVILVLTPGCLFRVSANISSLNSVKMFRENSNIPHFFCSQTKVLPLMVEVELVLASVGHGGGGWGWRVVAVVIVIEGIWGTYDHFAPYDLQCHSLTSWISQCNDNYHNLPNRPIHISCLP